MYLSPPIVSVYTLGVLWPRANAPGAVAAFAVGYTLGMLPEDIEPTTSLPLT